MQKEQLEKFGRVWRRMFFFAVALFFVGVFTNGSLSLWFERSSYALLILSVILNICYQVLSGLRDRRVVTRKRRSFIDLPPGVYPVSDKDTGTTLGSLDAEELNYLRKKFLENGMDDNELYFDSVTLSLFKRENPPEDLYKKLQEMLTICEPIEITWEARK